MPPWSNESNFNSLYNSQWVPLMKRTNMVHIYETFEGNYQAQHGTPLPYNASILAGAIRGLINRSKKTVISADKEKNQQQDDISAFIEEEADRSKQNISTAIMAETFEQYISDGEIDISIEEDAYQKALADPAFSTGRRANESSD